MIDHEVKESRLHELEYLLVKHFGIGTYTAEVYSLVAEMWDEAFELGVQKGMINSVEYIDGYKGGR